MYRPVATIDKYLDQYHKISTSRSPGFTGVSAVRISCTRARSKRYRNVTTTLVPMDPGNFYYLLKTENVRPVVEVLDELSQQLEVNRQLLAQVSHRADQLRFPSLVSGGEKSRDRNSTDTDYGSVASDDSEPAHDAVRHVLNQKYHLDQIISLKFNDKTYDDNREIDLLSKEILALDALLRGKTERNRQLMAIIHDYESFIIETILPALRADVLATRHPLDDVLVEKKFAMVSSVYKQYLANIELLDGLVKLFHQLVAVLDKYDDSHYQLLNQFEVLQNLRDNLVGFAQIEQI